MTNRTWRWLTFRSIGKAGICLACSVGVSSGYPSVLQSAEPTVRLVAAPESAPPPEPGPIVGKAAVDKLTLGLQQCLDLAQQKQPRLGVYRASLSAAMDGQRAIEMLCVPALIAHDLPIRRRQACLGVTIASAALDQAQQDTAYAVTRCYFSVVYYRQLEKVASGVAGNLRSLQKAAADALEAQAENMTKPDVDRATVYLEMAEDRQLQATEGVRRSLGALKEAIGLPPETCLDVLPGELPDQRFNLCLEELVAAALSRRAELVQVNTFAEVTSLEIAAQGTSHHLRLDTFAAAADIHSRPVPQESRGSEYRPGAELEEMPTLLVGKCNERMQHAGSLNERAQAVAEKTRNLVVLEVEDAFHRWEIDVARVPHASKAGVVGTQAAESLHKDHRTDPKKVPLNDVINAEVLKGQSSAGHYQALYHQILALTDLERATAGGVSVVALLQSVPKAHSNAGKKRGN